jgi:hypothetical protein
MIKHSGSPWWFLVLLTKMIGKSSIMMINKGNIMSYTVHAVSKAIELLFRVAEEGGKGRHRTGQAIG